MGISNLLNKQLAFFYDVYGRFCIATHGGWLPHVHLRDVYYAAHAQSNSSCRDLLQFV